MSNEMAKPDLQGRMPDSWACFDCVINTAPGLLNREQMEQALARDWADEGVNQTVDELSEVYTVKDKVWKAACMEAMAAVCASVALKSGSVGR